jgi:hypothetical protein
MYSDLFEHLQGGRSGSRSGGGTSSASTVQEPEPLVQLKAGKMILESSSSSSSAFHCVPDTTRGEIRLVWKNGHLKFQWYDRKRKTVVDDHTISAVTATASASSFQRVPLTAKIHAQDRIYVWTDCSISMNPPNYRMYWMQDQDETNEAEAIEKINQYLKDPKSAAPTTANDNNATAAAATASNAATVFANANAAASTTAATTGTASAASDNHQVDALSSILENLGMPQGDSSAASAASSENATATTATGQQQQRQLTLADLNLAMAELNHLPNSTSTSTASASRGPPLHEIVTHEAIDRILQDPQVRQRLMEFLPEEQRGDETALAENLKSPQIQSTLRTLTQTLLPDDTLDMSGYASLIANFQLDPQDGQEILMRQGDPIAAFLECIVKSAEREQQQQQALTTKDEEKEKELEEKHEEE